jgi:hypothetical protein
MFQRNSQDSNKEQEGFMKRILGLTLLFILSSVTLSAAKNSRTFYLPSDVRAGGVLLPRGICEVTWSVPTGSLVQLTIKTDDRRTVTVPARMVEGKQETTGAVTSVVNGITYLDELHTDDAKFIFENANGVPK